MIARVNKFDSKFLPMERCNICFLPVHDEYSMLRCPRCTNAFHKDHLAAWLLNNKSCPVCREELSISFRVELEPRDKQERKRLEDILYNLDNLGDVLGEWENKHRNRKRVAEMRTTVINEGESNVNRFMKVGFPIVLFVVWVFILIFIFGDNFL